MRDGPAWRRYLRFWGPNVDADVDDELRFHLDMRSATTRRAASRPTRRAERRASASATRRASSSSSAPTTTAASAAD